MAASGLILHSWPLASCGLLAVLAATLGLFANAKRKRASHQSAATQKLFFSEGELLYRAKQLPGVVGTYLEAVAAFLGVPSRDESDTFDVLSHLNDLLQSYNDSSVMQLKLQRGFDVEFGRAQLVTERQAVAHQLQASQDTVLRAALTETLNQIDARIELHRSVEAALVKQAVTQQLVHQSLCSCRDHFLGAQASSSPLLRVEWGQTARILSNLRQEMSATVRAVADFESSAFGS